MSTTQFIPKSLSLSEQVGIISTKYNIIMDRPSHQVKAYLTNISFCRFSNYLVKLNGVSFSKVIKYYELDRKLRLIILDAIERIEIAVKATLNNKLCNRHGDNPFWYQDKLNFNSTQSYDKFMFIVNDIKSKHRNESDIKSYIKKYSENLPIWLLLEKFSFGDLSKLYSFLNVDDAQLIAKHFGKTTENFKDHLQCLTYIRNLCAHHMNLFNKVMKLRLRGNKQLFIPKDKLDNLGGYLILVSHYLTTVVPSSSWNMRLFELLCAYKDNHGLLLDYWGIDKYIMQNCQLLI